MTQTIQTKKTLVIKCGGSILNNMQELAHLLTDINKLKALGYQIVIVHGGGPDINQLAMQLNIQSTFQDGLRVTSREILEVTQMALLGKTNAGLVQNLNQAQITAVGLSGYDMNLLLADFLDKAVLGYVGVIKEVNYQFLQDILALGIIPVIAPLAINAATEQCLNINADHAASAIAVAIGGDQLILLSDINGYYANYPDETSLVSVLTVSEIDTLLKTPAKVVSGMVPKLTACLEAVNGGVMSAHIINGKNPDGIILAVTKPQSIGTMVISEGGASYDN